MLILAGVSLNALLGNNGIITNAQRASIMSKFSTYKEELGMNALEDTGVYASGDKLKQYIPSMEEQDIDKFVIMKSNLLYIDSDELESSVAQNLGLGGGIGDSSDSGAAIKEIQNIISGVVELKEDFSDKVPVDDSQLLDEPEHTNNAEGLIGTRLFDRNSLNINNHTWNILDEYNSKNEKTARYGSGYYWLKKGVTYTIDGEEIEFKNDYIIDYSKNEYIVLSGRAVNWNENSTLAVTDGLVLNIDPISLADGEWVNCSSEVYDNIKTYENELALANAITDEEIKEIELNKVRKENIYTFWVRNPITGEWSNTGTQKKGDVVYDEKDKAIKFNKDEENNPMGMGGYIQLMKSGVDCSNGFSFEMYFTTDRLRYSIGSVKYGTRPTENFGLFCKMPDLTGDWTSAMRFGWSDENYVCKFRQRNPGQTFSGENLSTSIHGSVDARNIGYSVGETVYITFVYVRYNQNIESELYDDRMKNEKIDKVLYYINGELFGYTYYDPITFSEGLSIWNNDNCPFFIGACPWYNNGDVYYLKGECYANRLYTIPMSERQVKDNYDMTLKYRSSF